MELFVNTVLATSPIKPNNQGEDHLVIDARRISKRFGKNQVLDNLDFSLPKGQIYGISGSNGVGKSVFLRIIVGLIIPDSGKIIVNNQKVGIDVEFPDKVGALIDHPGFLLSESAYRNLHLLAIISGKADEETIYKTMRFVVLDPNDHKPMRTYSVGMRQRLGLAQAIMEDPDLLILDEPTAGLDFDAQKEIYDYLLALRREGKTILITSHSLNEIKFLCDKAFQLRDGKLEQMTQIDSTTAYR